VAELGTSAHWYLQKRLQARLVAEVEAVRERFPAFALKKSQEGDLFWVGELETNFGSRYRVKISYPPTYPNRPPAAFVVHPKLNPSPHTYGENSQLCLFDPNEGHSRGFDPNGTTAATVIAWVGEWLACYEVFLQTGQWVTGRREHT